MRFGTNCPGIRGDAVLRRLERGLLVLAACSTVRGQPLEACKAVAELGHMSGEFLMQGGPSAGSTPNTCTWRISPNRHLKLIDFRVSQASSVGKNDSILLHAAGQLLAAFSHENPLPAEMVVMDSDIVMWTLISWSPDTQIRIKYTCAEKLFINVLGLDLNSRISHLTVFVLALVVVFMLSACLGYLRSRGDISQIVGCIEEQWIQSQLLELPQSVYRDIAGDIEECCLCLECFEAEDTLKTLPCNHYFHKDCIDSWFSSQKYHVRRCPLCNTNPLSAGRSLWTRLCTGCVGRPAADNPHLQSESSTPLREEPRLMDSSNPPASSIL